MAVSFSSIGLGLLLLGVSLHPLPATACEDLPAGAVLWVRLKVPVSSYSSKPGTPLRAILIRDVECEGTPVFYAGTEVEGVVHSVQKVGMGFRHETASLELDFNRVNPPFADPVEIHTRVVEVENARETVKKGVIRGIRGTDTPQGIINSRLKHLPTWNPYSDSFLLAFKVAFPVFPEPEIHYDPGTDLQIELTSPLPVPAIPPPMILPAEFREEETAALDEMAWSLPTRTSNKQKQDADLVNLLFIGSREQMERAFQISGWQRADTVSTRSVLQNFNALLTLSSYPEAPMSILLLNDAPPDVTRQKTLNSYAKRHHLRIWKQPVEWQGQDLWVGSATWDTRATLSLRHHRFVHHIDANIDEERTKIVRDLTVAGCADAVYLAPRPDIPHFLENATGDPFQTDGAIAVVRLKDCDPAPSSASTTTQLPYRPRSRFARFLRRQILTFRSDIWRANVIYGSWDLGRMIFSAARKRNPPMTEPALVGMSQAATNSVP